uniref:Uncharacterized protein n=1 Tax=Quercus lobata TaxID=97700 RepID=A0A7N2L6B8_QUELO
MSSQGLGLELAEARPFEAKRRAVCFTRASVVFYLGVGPNGLALVRFHIIKKEKSHNNTKLKTETRLVQHQPTQYPASEEMSIGKIKFNAFDLGGHQIARRVWKDFYAKIYGCVWTEKNLRFGYVDHLSRNSRIPIKFFHQDIYNCRSISGYFDATEGLGRFTIKNNMRNICAEDEKLVMLELWCSTKGCDPRFDGSLWRRQEDSLETAS